MNNVTFSAMQGESLALAVGSRTNLQKLFCHGRDDGKVN